LMPIAFHIRWIFKNIGEGFDGRKADKFFMSHEAQK
jgi:hypothetical protein